ncbi:hypothetical protein MJO29_000747 [Puccinia striiformis f. sp. tritici]|uniref:DDE Tnp4 domain-containing protein n=2 Tax=Puccinia striiformis f. sp. tritici TaxID=168172 RepID=A0A0L0US44_9BASI|nr:hypothetical protein MJO29_000747 [Puccinia striiformis f. sp. tritici]KNE89731.1 hypothetical protein, variant [Puccinia striiformis f. sp. tritici PST-78]
MGTYYDRIAPLLCLMLSRPSECSSGSTSSSKLSELEHHDDLEHLALIHALLHKDGSSQRDEGDSENSDDEDSAEDEDECDSDRECTKKPLDLTWLFKLPDKQFRQATRTSKTSFLWIFNQIKDNPIFRREGAPQFSIVQQLALTLELFGSNGREELAGPLAAKLGLSRRDAIKVIYGPMQAILALGSRYVTWPNDARKQSISNVMKNQGFEGCVGSLDDITVPTSFSPGDDSFLNSKTGRYSINAQIVCDSNNRITACFSGWPGDWRGSLSYEKTPLHQNPKKFFDPGEYLIADSAYRPSRTIVPPSNAPAPKAKPDEEFDFCLAKAHGHSEKTIGGLKARWASLKEIRLSRNAGVKHYIQWIHCCTILYNMLAQFGDPWDQVDNHPSKPLASPPTVRNTRTLDSFRSTVKSKCIEHNYRTGTLPIPRP